MWQLIVVTTFLILGIISYAVIEVPPAYPPSPLTGEAQYGTVNDDPNVDPTVARGKELYDIYCFTCHGYNGDGVPVTPEALQTQYGDPIYARDFTGKSHMEGKVVFKYTWAGYGGEFASDEDLKLIIRHGLYGTPMPGFTNLSDEELDAIIAYIKSLNDGWQDYQAPDAPTVVIPEDLYSQERVDRGRELFLQKCIACHQDQEQDMEPAPQPVMWYVPGTDSLMMITARDFLNEPLRLPKPEHVFRTIKVGLGGTTMNPALWQDLSDDQLWDLVSYVYFLRNKGKQQPL